MTMHDVLGCHARRALTWKTLVSAQIVATRPSSGDVEEHARERAQIVRSIRGRGWYVPAP
jgi:hypothetical protein